MRRPAALLLLALAGCRPGERPAAPLVDSTALPGLAVVRTPGSPAPRGKTVIYCASFALAWKELKERVIGSPIRIQGVEEAAEELNRASPSEEDLPESFYAAAGRMRDGILDRIPKEMAERFPSVPKPVLPGSDDPENLVAYSYLEADARFALPFFRNERPFEFTDSRDVATRARSFGLRPKDEGGYQDLDWLPFRQSGSGQSRPEADSPEAE